MVRIIFMYFEIGVGEIKCGNKCIIRSSEANVRGDLTDSVVWIKVVCGIELVNGSSIKVAMKGKWGGKFRCFNKFNGIRIFRRVRANMFKINKVMDREIFRNNDRSKDVCLDVCAET